ncbi:MAG TPA: DUF4232 domain-containing protein [Streptosporangiaceae bacterium]|nr:DUF4232 domain-containing protein [Streptosporangiaceae bacterium]
MITDVVRAARPVAVVAAAIAGVTAMALVLTAPSAPRSPSALASATTGLTPCTAADLGVWVEADWMGGAMGTLSMPLEFTNLSDHACTLRGLPRVFAIGRDGSPLGSPAAPDRAGPEQTVRLAPGQTGYAVLGYSDVMTGDCPSADRATAFELRVYPPGRHSADHALWDFGTCSARGSSVFMRVSAIAPGAGD